MIKLRYLIYPKLKTLNKILLMKTPDYSGLFGIVYYLFFFTILILQK